MMESSLQAVQSLVNRALATDETAGDALLKLQGASLGIECVAPSVSILVSIDEGQVQLQPWQRQCDQEETESKPSVSIRGKLTDLLRMAMQMADQGQADLANSGVRVDGDVGVLLSISRTFARLEIDWEFLLAKLIGEKPAHLAFMGLAEARRVAPTVQARAVELGVELVSQAGLLRGADVEAMQQQIRQLQYRVDRLQARLGNLEPRS